MHTPERRRHTVVSRSDMSNRKLRGKERLLAQCQREGRAVWLMVQFAGRLHILAARLICVGAQVHWRCCQELDRSDGTHKGNRGWEGLEKACAMD